MLCITHQFGFDYMLESLDFLDHFFLVVIDFAVILVVWLGVNGVMFLIYFVTLV